MANLTTAADIVDYILANANESTDGSSSHEGDALIFLNRAYQALADGGGELLPGNRETWWWLRKDPPAVLTLEPFIETGSVAVTNNSTTISFSSAPTKDLDNWFFKVTGHGDVFRISAHTSGAAAATLDAVYTGDTDATASYRVFKLEYELASDLRELLSPMRVTRDDRREIEGADMMGMEDLWPLSRVGTGVPRMFAMVDETKVRFSHYGGLDSTDLIRVEYDYNFVPTDLTDAAGSVPVVPRHHRHVLADYATYMMALRKGDSRAANFLSSAQAGAQAMMVEQKKRQSQIGRHYGRIFTRQKLRWPRQLRTESGLIVG